jgi:hypothetical protein
MVNMSNNHCNG